MLSYSISICAQNCYSPLKILQPEIELQTWGITRSFKSQDLSGIALLPLGFCFFHFVLAGRELRQCGRGSPLFSFVFFPKRVASGLQGGTFCGPGLPQTNLTCLQSQHHTKKSATAPSYMVTPTCQQCPALRSGKAWSLSCPCQLPAVSPPEKVKSLYEIQPDRGPAARVPFLTELLPPER